MPTGRPQGAGCGAAGGTGRPAHRVVSALITSPPQRSLNCNTTYSEEPQLLRTALGESTASLDSTGRWGPGALAAPGGGLLPEQRQASPPPP